MTPPPTPPLLITLVGPTASGKTALALHLAERLNGEIVSCDSVAVYRGLDIGSAKPSPAERALIPHHALDLYDPDQPCTAGDYARHARHAIADITARGKTPIVAGGTGLYLRALLEGLAPAPPRNAALRTRLTTSAEAKGTPYLHRILHRLDPAAATRIHPNDLPKLIRSLEVTLTARTPQTAQWQTGRDPLLGYRIVQLGLNPDRKSLYARIDHRAAAMFAGGQLDRGLLAETATLRARFGDACPALQSLGYLQALQVLRNELPLPAAIAAAQQGHRNYAKRQLTWFRRTPSIHWLPGFGNDPTIQSEALALTLPPNLSS